jgi:polysaccharide export outer membrane protein
MNRQSRQSARIIAWLVMASCMAVLTGCEVDSFFDPSKTGRFEHTPTLVPILDRLDVVEPDDEIFARTTPPRPEDLLPSDLSYRLEAGDVVTVEIYGIVDPDRWTEVTRRVDAAGNYRLPELGDVAAAGLTPQEFQDQVVRMLAERVMPNPQVNVVVEEGGALHYLVYGAVQQPGLFTLRNPDFRLLDAIAVAGGAEVAAETVYVIRQVALSEEMTPFPRSGERPAAPGQPAAPPVDIEKLIEELDRTEPTKPGMLSDQDSDPAIDIDEMQPAEPPEQVEPAPAMPAQPDSPRAIVPDQPGSGDSFIYVEELGQWVRVRSRPPATGEADGQPARQELILERVIEIPYRKLSRGDSSYNIVVRADDRIFVDGPEVGVVYIDGEIARPGVYNMPFRGRLTISRLVAAAGGLAPLAVPTRVDLVRVVGKNREAKLRLNLSAIRQGTEPDVYVKPDDHIVIGTTWWATPLAVVRNGFRATYGFGFLLDRNFGSDVFGVPPDSQFR